MAKSRYAGVRVIDGSHYATWRDPSRGQYAGDILEGVNCVDHVFNAGDRFDTLAHRYYGDSEFWWVIALCNRISDPFADLVGRTLRIPLDVRTILDKVTYR